MRSWEKCSQRGLLVSYFSCTDYFTQSRSHGPAREEDTPQRRKIYLRILVTIAENFLAWTYWLFAVFTHWKLPIVTPGVKNLYKGDSKLGMSYYAPLNELGLVSG